MSMRHNLQPGIAQWRAIEWRIFYSFDESVGPGSLYLTLQRYRIENNVYGCETKSPMKAKKNMLAVTKKVRECKMLGVSLRDHINNETPIEKVA